MSWRSWLVIAVLAAAGCGDSPEQGPRIVVVLAGGPGIGGARLAAAEVNRDTAGDSIEVVIAPHGYNTSAEAAIDLAREFSADPRTIAVVGHNNSASSLAAAQVYNAEHVVQIAPTSTATAYSTVGPYSFRMVPDDRHQAERLAAIAIREARNRRVAVGYANDDYGRGLLHELQPLLQQAGVQVVLAAPHMEPADTSVLRRFAIDLAAAQADLLLWLGRAPPLEVVLAAGPVPPVVGSDGMENGIVEARDISRFRGVRFTRFIDPRSTEPGLRDFGRRYEAATRIPLNTEAVYVYDAIKLLASLIRGGADTREALRARLAEVGNEAAAYQGIGGVVAFDRNGDVRRPYLVALVTDSGIVPAASE